MPRSMNLPVEPERAPADAPTGKPPGSKSAPDTTLIPSDSGPRQSPLQMQDTAAGTPPDHAAHGPLQAQGHPLVHPLEEALKTGKFGNQVWGDFELGELLGWGGMGAVYRGRQTSLDRPVAVKVLGRHLSDNENFRKRFLREARAVAQINSQHVVQIYSAGVHDGHHFFVMELVEGIDLARKLKDGFRPSNGAAFDLVLQAARGLAAAGRLGIVHRDIKPANMLITGDGVLKLTDFGLVKLVSEDRAASGTDAGLTGTGIIVGTASYFSPEQGLGERCDQRTDLYALGVVAYELLTGRLPFSAADTTSIIYQHVHQAPRPPRDINPSLHPDLHALVLRCLEKKPDDRVQTAADLVQELERLAISGRITMHAKPPRALRWALSALAAVAAVIVITLVALVARPHARPGSAPAMVTSHQRADATGTPRVDPESRIDAFPPSSSAEPGTEELQALLVPPDDGGTDQPVTASPVITPATAAPPAPALTTTEAWRATDELPKPRDREADVPAALSPAPAQTPLPRQLQIPTPSVDDTVGSTATRSNPPTKPTAHPAVAHAAPTTKTKPDPAPTVKPHLDAVSDDPDAIIIARPLPVARPQAIHQDQFGRYADLLVLGATQRFRYCPPGRFLMGSPDDEQHRGRDEDIHQVTLTEGFWIADCECSQAFYTTVVGDDPSASQDVDLPVEQVSWDMAQAFVRRLNALVPGLKARLPSEAEWEYAARAGDLGPSAHPLERMGWCSRNALKTTHAMKRLLPNAWGLFDCQGNVAEWCQDSYADYEKPVAVDPHPPAGGAPVIRGGSFRDSPDDCRAAHRDHARTKYLSDHVGFRLAASAIPGETISDD